MIFSKKIKRGIFTGGVSAIVFFFVSTLVAFAQDGDYTPLVVIPGFEEGSTSIPDFVNMVYRLTIALGALFGVIKIAIAGVQYSMSDVVTKKEDAKKNILGVLLGLAILLMPYIVLSTIYPGLLDLNFTEQISNPGFRQVEEGNPGGGGGSSELEPNQRQASPLHCHQGGFWGSPMSDADCVVKCEMLAQGDPDFVRIINIVIINTPVYQNPGVFRKTCEVTYEVSTE